jgi:hypothetical protein
MQIDTCFFFLANSDAMMMLLNDFGNNDCCTSFVCLLDSFVFYL